ncbi:unnamed protein product, partial [Chrysoparadoxa australica]
CCPEAQLDAVDDVCCPPDEGPPANDPAVAGCCPTDLFIDASGNCCAEAQLNTIDGVCCPTGFEVVTFASGASATCCPVNDPSFEVADDTGLCCDGEVYVPAVDTPTTCCGSSSGLFTVESDTPLDPPVQVCCQAGSGGVDSAGNCCPVGELPSEIFNSGVFECIECTADRQANFPRGECCDLFLAEAVTADDGTTTACCPAGDSLVQDDVTDFFGCCPPGLVPPLVIA